MTTHRPSSLLSLALTLVATTPLGCANDMATQPFLEVPCAPSQTAPYPNGVPYLGIHGDRGNSDLVDCRTASAFAPRWHALDGLGLMQPNTFSPDGTTTYATTTHPDPDGCRLHAVDVESGAVRWCLPFHGSIARSAVEVDEAGHLYLTVEHAVVSLTADGATRWLTSLDEERRGGSPWGLHFTPGGRIATVTSQGRVVLLDRDRGDVLATLSIPERFGFPLLEGSAEVDTSALMPPSVQRNIAAVWGDGTGDEGPGFGSFLGVDDFVDNTLAVAPDGSIYVMGGGAGENEGALVQIRVREEDGEPVLEPGWFTPTRGGSATSPSVSRDGRFVVVSDGATGGVGGEAPARVIVMDIPGCDANRDADAEEQRCAVAYDAVLERGPLPGSPAIADDGTVYFYELGLDFSAPETARDLVAFGPDGVSWEASLPNDLDWTSVITVSTNHLIGTATRVDPSARTLAELRFPLRSEDYLVVLDRFTGELVYDAPVRDDSAATVTVGPDGSLYVGMLGLVSVLTLQERPQLGLTRFAPTAL